MSVSPTSVAPPPAVAGAPKPDPILISDAVVRRFGGMVAVDVDHLEIQRGWVTSLIGPNGAGKSTFFNVISGFDRPHSGRWSHDRRPLSRRGASHIARDGVVRTFQHTRTLARLSVLENVVLAAPGQAGERFWSALWPPLWRHQEAAIERRARDLLRRFGLEAMQELPAGQLSGGQRKLLELARAVMTEPTLLLLDEPMAGVNPVLREQLLGHIATLRDAGMTVLLIEHDMDVVAKISDWVICMAEGRVIAEGSVDAVRRDPDVIDAYLGRRRPARPAAKAAAPSPTAAAPDRRQAPAFEVRDLVAGYVPGVDVLRGCNLRAQRGELVGIFGPNGAGKSTLLKAVFGHARVRSGAICLNGKDVTGAPPHALISGGIGHVPQMESVFATLRVAENLRMGLYLRPRRWAERRDAMVAQFPILAGLMHKRAGDLSGGERKVVAMARALMMDPQVLLLDEPSAGLSPTRQDELFELVQAINRAGVTIVIVEQNARQCLAICDRGYVLDRGRNAFAGTSEALLNDPKVIELYLGSLSRNRADTAPARPTAS